MFSSNYQLLIYPESPINKVDEEFLSYILKDLDFIGDVEEASKTLRFQTGDKFLSHICFLGCSPDIELHPQKDKAYTYIEIPESTSAVQFFSGVNIKIPRCPDCKKELTGLPKLLNNRMESDAEINCQHCQVLIDRYSLNWRRTACFSRSKIVVGNIYESEAVPDDQFLILLNEKTGFSWKYAYIRFL